MQVKKRRKAVARPAPVKWLDRSIAVSIHYCLVTSEEMFYRELRRLKLSRDEHPDFIASKQSHGTTHFLVHEGKQVAMVAIRPEKRDLVEIHGLLVHEAVHIWQRTREVMRERDPSSEFEAYSIQWVSQQLMWEYRKQKARK